MKVMGRDSLMIDREVVDLRYVEQLVDTEQLGALGYLLKYGGSHLIDGKGLWCRWWMSWNGK